jgi:hypothetical protein
MLQYYNHYNALQSLINKAVAVKELLNDAYTQGQLSSYCSATYTPIEPAPADIKATK